ncbi:cytochrome c [uncultured Hydrogenophaga sp.]|jgi:mono/diheme cytochrome c family protein|uniref:c-type cytochrome n=1 Tax=uncultured Hydrogenophaga sp. TaxID=199683 RepID=UPI0025855CA1|nr:cytochrome c [uncultured Hydrogenophaga sp.]
MERTIKGTVLLAGLLGALAAQAQAPQASVDLGKLEFTDNCAACHGVDGKGNGPLGGLLQKSPPDLSQLAKKNGGVLPVNRMYAVIEGTAAIPSHGVRDMPIWGREYRIEEGQRLREARGLYEPAEVVRARILTLIEYISRLQTQ